MALIRPFKALRPRKEIAEKVAALPYDVMNVQEARDMAKGNPFSFLHVSRPEIDLATDVDPYNAAVYEQGHANLRNFIKEQVLIEDQQEHYYVYRQQMGKVVQCGLVACASVDDYESGVIKKHELTRADKEEDRVKHIDYLDANDEPVFYTYRHSAEIDGIVAEVTRAASEYDFTTSDAVRHTLWVIREPAIIDRLTSLFNGIATLYVADGHHRSAAAGRVRDIRKKSNQGHTGKEEYNFFLTVIFPDHEMNIMPYNRVVESLNGNTAEQFLEAVKTKFDLKKVAGPVNPLVKHTFGMYIDGQWYELFAKEGTFNPGDAVSRLDVSILQDNLLRPILGIDNPRTDKRINFVGGIRGTQELEKIVNSGEYKVGFSLHPTSIEELMQLADAGQIMPPKSTWFEPKLRSGLFIHLLS